MDRVARNMRPTAITLPFGDSEAVTFDLRLGEIRKIQAQTGLGPAVILHELQSDAWKVDHYRETILQGLLGGGMKVEEARKLVVKWVDERPARESLLTAQAILMSWILGAPEPKKVPVTEEKKTEEIQETALDASTSSPSTEQPLPSALVLES